ncbi:FAD-dependent oxidoreductase [Pelomonas sp. CA6]|uniref:NAD(P)/FAD-dependent oxidoreductase n=1 Tax=Pelomonas sp. CA6 TaxID=2907999 RepID=UPI001F4B42C4|nr:FAD-dependent oxidoreductase [Pelomonas sp. CA6]MCH7342153.1 FAD-dependent oxidoreductase [Pelomonas sp. CA6]
MRVAIVGAGLAGMCCAHELAQAGHDVQVFERSTGVATGASFAPAGLIAPGWLAAQPDLGALQWTDRPRHAAWRWSQWRHKAEAPGALHELAALGRERLAELKRQLQPEYEESHGLLLLWRRERDLQQDQPLLQRLERQGHALRLLDAQACREIEPGLAPELTLHAGLHLRQDESGNARQFVQALRGALQQLGAGLHLQAEVQGLEPGPRPLLKLADRSLEFDAVVLCAGAGSPALLAGLGLQLPLAPVHGYTLTAPLRQLEAHPDLGPKAALMDMQQRVALTRLGQRVRVSGGPELGGDAEQLGEKPLARLQRVLDDVFPGAQQHGSVQRWKWQRALLPSGLPLIGASGKPGIWLNIGHGEHGWILALGAAHLLAQRIQQQPTAIDTQALEPAALH